AHTMAIATVAIRFFMPLMGRSGTRTPGDAVLAVLFTLVVSSLLSFSGRFLCFVPVKELKRLRTAFAVASLLAIAWGSLRNPYSHDCPKRLMLQHVHRETVLPNGQVVTDAGLWLNALDFRGLVPLKPYLKPTQWRHLTSMKAPQALVGNAEEYSVMPWMLPLKHLLPEKKSWYLRAAVPVIPSGQQRATLEVLSSKFSAETNRRMIHLHFTGPTHLNLFIDARNTTLTSWSIGNGIDGPAPESDDTYILQFCSGTSPSTFHFWIEATTDAPIEVIVVGHFVELSTPEMDELREALPSWVATKETVSTWSTIRI
ncbi:hypothetical protein Gpo141_00012490, partial [Globisporangium polare]